MKDTATRNSLIYTLVVAACIALSCASCSLEDKTAYFRAVNASTGSNYDDVITDIYVCQGATDDNYASVWNGRLSPGRSVKFDVTPGKYGIKFVGIRYYHSGIEKPISVTTGYKTPVTFDGYYTVRVTYDGTGIVAEEEQY